MVILQDPFPITSCFSSGQQLSDDPAAAATRSGQSIIMSVYSTKIAGQCRLITVTWCRNVLAHGLSVSLDGSDDGHATDSCGGGGCKVEMRPWNFWRKVGLKRLEVEGTDPVEVFWDLRSAKFSSSSGEPEPQSSYYVAVAAGDEVLLLLGDAKKEAYRRTGRRPAAIEAALVSRKEHVFGKKKFTSRSKLHEKGRRHEISIECSGSGAGGGSIIGGNVDTEMVVRIDGAVAVHVKHLQWKFRGNQSIMLGKAKVDVFWDVHDWLFSPGLRHALFIFKPQPPKQSNCEMSPSSSSPPPPPSTSSSTSTVNSVDHGFCLFLYAWKVE